MSWQWVSWVSPPFLLRYRQDLGFIERQGSFFTSFIYICAPNDCKSLPLTSFSQPSKTTLLLRLSPMACKSPYFSHLSSIDHPARASSTTRSTVISVLVSMIFFLLSLILVKFYFLHIFVQIFSSKLQLRGIEQAVAATLASSK